MNPDVDESPIFGGQSLSSIIEQSRRGGSLDLTKVEYLQKIGDLSDIIAAANAEGNVYIDYVAQLANGRNINDMSREELAELYTSANRAFKAALDAKFAAAYKAAQERRKLAGISPDYDPTAAFIARQGW
jgi:hypothetical protein